MWNLKWLPLDMMKKILHHSNMLNSQNKNNITYNVEYMASSRDKAQTMQKVNKFNNRQMVPKRPVTRLFAIYSVMWRF